MFPLKSVIFHSYGVRLLGTYGQRGITTVSNHCDYLCYIINVTVESHGLITWSGYHLLHILDSWTLFYLSASFWGLLCSIILFFIVSYWNVGIIVSWWFNGDLLVIYWWFNALKFSHPRANCFRIQHFQTHPMWIPMWKHRLRGAALALQGGLQWQWGLGRGGVHSLHVPWPISPRAVRTRRMVFRGFFLRMSGFMHWKKPFPISFPGHHHFYRGYELFTNRWFMIVLPTLINIPPETMG